MVIPEVQFFEIEGEFFRIYTMIFQQPFLCEKPKPFNPVDIHLPIREPLSMVDSPMVESISDKFIVTSQFISVDKTSPFYFLDRQFQKSLTLNIGRKLHGHLSPSFQDAEYRYLSRRSPSTFSFSSLSKVRFIHFNLAGKEGCIHIGCEDSIPDERMDILYRVIG